MGTLTVCSRERVTRSLTLSEVHGEELLALESAQAGVQRHRERHGNGGPS